MALSKSRTGRAGEDAAASFLEKKGYRILERNYSNALGEIDIVAKDGDTLCFIEVKTREDDRFGSPFEAVTAAKQRKIARVAKSYLQSKRQFDDKARFDVVAVRLHAGRAPDVEVIKNAFETT